MMERGFLMVMKSRSKYCTLMRLERGCYPFEKVKPFKETFVITCHISPTRSLEFGQIGSAISPSDVLLALRLLALP